METKENQIEKSEKKVSQTEDFFEEFFDYLEEDLPENCPRLEKDEGDLERKGSRDRVN